MLPMKIAQTLKGGCDNQNDYDNTNEKKKQQQHATKPTHFVKKSPLS